MAVLDGIRRRIATALLPSDGKASANPGFNVIATQQPNLPVYSEMTVRKATREGYKISVYVYRAVRTIVQAASGIPWVMQKDGETIDKHEFTSTWAKPNKEFSGQDNMEFIIAHQLLCGNSLIQPIYVRGKPFEFWVCMPDLIQPIPSDIRGEWLKGWKITEANGQSHDAPPEQFIHFMQMDPGNPYWGIGPLMAAARTVDTDNEAQDAQKVSMQNRGVPDGVFTHETPLTQEQFEEARRQIRENFLAKARSREPWVLGAGSKWNQMSLTAVEMDYIASRLANVRAIAAAFGLDPWWLGDRAASTYNNVMEARKALYEDVVIPLLDDIRSTLNLKIAPLYGNDLEITYDVSGIPALRSDFTKKVEQAQKLWMMGVPFDKINEKLEMGFDEFPGWDVGYLNAGVLPVGSPSSPIEDEEDPDKSISMIGEFKILNIVSEEGKVALWKMVDRRRMGWWPAVAKKMKGLYDMEISNVIKAASKITDVDQMEAAIKRAIEAGKPEWEKVMTAVSVALIEDFGARTAEDLGSEKMNRKWRFDPLSQLAKDWISKHGAEAVRTIAETNLGDVRSVILAGKTDNLTVPQIAQKLKGFYNDRSAFKSMRIARTEVSASAGFGQREAAKQSGVVKTKKWITSRDNRVRDAHISMDGEERQINEVYSNGLMYPGDPGGYPEESIMCRCTEQYLSREPS